MKPLLVGLTVGLIIYAVAHWGAHWDQGDSTIIAALWTAMSYILARVLGNPEPRVPKG